jgi:hypothetical protein
VALEYSHREDAMSDPSSVRVLYLSRPWRTGGWRVVEDGSGREAADSDACGVTAVVLREGRDRRVEGEGEAALQRDVRTRSRVAEAGVRGGGRDEAGEWVGN